MVDKKSQLTNGMVPPRKPLIIDKKPSHTAGVIPSKPPKPPRKSK